MARSLHALIIDDSAMTRHVIMRTLKDTGLADFTFDEAADGVEALETYAPDTYDLLFVDMHMPRMDGVTFLNRLHSEYASYPPAVMITAESSQERLLAVINEAGVDALLLKPIDVERLREGLRQLIQAIPERRGRWSVPHGECTARAMQEIMQQMCRIELTPLAKEREHAGGRSIFGVISLSGGIEWTVLLGFAESAALAAVSNLIGEPMEADDPDLGDAIAEVTNNVAGQIKRLLIDRGLSVRIALPTVMCAEGFRFLVQHGHRQTADKVHFDTPVGDMWLHVSVGMHKGLMF